MQNKKFSLIFDATILANGLNKNSSRAGIYFVAKNLLNEFVKKDNLRIKLYCNYKKAALLEQVLKLEFSNYNFEIISDLQRNLLTKSYDFALIHRTNAKNNKYYVKKFFWDLLCRFLKLPFPILRYFHNKTLAHLECEANAILSVYTKIPERFSTMDIKKYILLHDTIPDALPDYRNGLNLGSWYRELVDSLNSKDYYFTNSEYTKNDFLKYYPIIDPNKITVTLLAASEYFIPCSLENVIFVKNKYHIPQDKKYIFSLCTLDPRKNLVRAVKTFIEFIQKNNINDLVFALGGSQWDRFIKIISKEVIDFDKYSDKVLKLGYVDDKDLSALYSGAEWFVYTSQYEGFGLPPLEAMSCKCPVITSNCTSIPEVVGNAGITIDWNNDEQHIEAYEKYYFNDDLKMEMAQKGLERSKQFSWEKCANKIIEEMLR